MDNHLTFDIISHICIFVFDNKTKCNVLRTCRGISKYIFSFHEPININKIMKSRWYHHFTNIITGRNISRYPKEMTHLRFIGGFNFRKSRIPASVTHLSFSGYYADRWIK